MIKSMTGYGKANLSKDLRQYNIEMKSVNNRYLDISVKLPKVISYLEEDIKKSISSKIKRGKIDVFITFQNDSTEGKNIQINKEIASIYIKELKKLADQENILSNIEVTEISKYPDVLSIKYEQDDEIIKKELLEVVDITVQNLVNMKKQEGEKISKDLEQRLEDISQRVVKVSELSKDLINEYIIKLEDRIKEILNTDEIDKSRISQEVVIYADKSSVEEEITRLKSHLSQINNLLSSNEAVGKKMDFIIQEMNRETNTIGSKSGSLDITNEVVEIKSQIENIREQVQNIE